MFSCGWHITRDDQDVYSWKLKFLVKVFGPHARLARFADLDGPRVTPQSAQAGSLLIGADPWGVATRGERSS